MKNRYLTGLIPKDKKVLNHTFKGSASVQQAKPFAVQDVIIPSLAAALAVLFSNNNISTVLLLAPFLLVLPKAALQIEKVLSVKLTGLVKAIFSILLIAFALPFGIATERIAEENLTKKLLTEQEEAKQLALARAQENVRLDSLTHYMELVSKVSTNVEESLQLADKASTYVRSDSERSKLTVLTNGLKSQKIDRYIKKGDYKNAIGLLNNLIDTDSKNDGNYYRRAVCYQKINQNQKAVDDLKTAISFGSTAAERLHNKINPLKRRVIYYVTRCCDGTTSNARGRGACSWHGGVCNWNEPVYEEYRQYE